MKKNAKRRVGTLVASLILLGGASVAMAPAASALPSCGSPTYNGNFAAVSCGGSGDFRLAVTCYKAWPWESTWTKYGAWTNAPLSGTFAAACNTLTNDYRVALERR